MKFKLRTFLFTCLLIGIAFGVGVPHFFKDRVSQSTPPDILRKITAQYGYFSKGDQVQKIVEEFHTGERSLNVPSSQFCRAILFLSDGDFDEFVRLADISEDPRDTLCTADKKAGNPKHWFCVPFQD